MGKLCNNCCDCFRCPIVLEKFSLQNGKTKTFDLDEFYSRDIHYLKPIDKDIDDFPDDKSSTCKSFIFGKNKEYNLIQRKWAIISRETGIIYEFGLISDYGKLLNFDDFKFCQRDRALGYLINTQFLSYYAKDSFSINFELVLYYSTGATINDKFMLNMKYQDNHIRYGNRSLSAGTMLGGFFYQEAFNIIGNTYDFNRPDNTIERYFQGDFSNRERFQTDILGNQFYNKSKCYENCLNEELYEYKWYICIPDFDAFKLEYFFSSSQQIDPSTGEPIDETIQIPNGPCSESISYLSRYNEPGSFQLGQRLWIPDFLEQPLYMNNVLSFYGQDYFLYDLPIINNNNIDVIRDIRRIYNYRLKILDSGIIGKFDIPKNDRFGFNLDDGGKILPAHYNLSLFADYFPLIFDLEEIEIGKIPTDSFKKINLNLLKSWKIVEENNTYEWKLVDSENIDNFKCFAEIGLFDITIGKPHVYLKITIDSEDYSEYHELKSSFLCPVIKDSIFLNIGKNISFELHEHKYELKNTNDKHINKYPKLIFDNSKIKIKIKNDDISEYYSQKEINGYREYLKSKIPQSTRDLYNDIGLEINDIFIDLFDGIKAFNDGSGSGGYLSNSNDLIDTKGDIAKNYFGIYRDFIRFSQSFITTLPTSYRFGGMDHKNSVHPHIENLETIIEERPYLCNASLETILEYDASTNYKLDISSTSCPNPGGFNAHQESIDKLICYDDNRFNDSECIRKYTTVNYSYNINNKDIVYIIVTVKSRTLDNGILVAPESYDNISESMPNMNTCNASFIQRKVDFSSLIEKPGTISVGGKTFNLTIKDSQRFVGSNETVIDPATGEPIPSKTFYFDLIFDVRDLKNFDIILNPGHLVYTGTYLNIEKYEAKNCLCKTNGPTYDYFRKIETSGTLGSAEDGVVPVAIRSLRYGQFTNGNVNDIYDLSNIYLPINQDDIYNSCVFIEDDNLIIGAP